MARIALALLATLATGCLFQTSTSDGKTTRTNTVTGKSERLVGDRWVPIKEATPTARPATFSQADLDTCAKASREPVPGERMSELEKLRILGRCP